MSSRRRGNEDSNTRAMLVASATRLLADEGVGAVTARRVAQTVGLSHQIIHYYFKTMDDLVIAVIEAGVAGAVDDLVRAMDGAAPLQAIVDVNSTLMSVAVGTEFTLYANRRPAVREAIRTSIERFRAAQTRLMARHLEMKGLSRTVPAEAATVLLTSVLRTLALERAVGGAQGHDETLAWLAGLLLAPELARGGPNALQGR
jgi:AcrR family transcriptional regulator